MEKLIPFTVNDLAKVTNFRCGEVKFGEKMITVPKNSDAISFLKTCEAKYVLFGIPEDIGVRANYGRPGAASAWESAIKSIANIQHNRFCKGSQLLVLGQLDVTDEMAESQKLDFNAVNDRKKLNQLVHKIDKEVSHIIFNIIINSRRITWYKSGLIIRTLRNDTYNFSIKIHYEFYYFIFVFV